VCSSWQLAVHFADADIFRFRWHPAILVGWFSCCLLPAAPSLGLLILNTMVLSRAYLQHASVPSGPFSFPALSLGVILAFSLHFDVRPWNPSLQGYSLPPRVLSDALLPLCHTKSLIHRCFPSCIRVNVLTPWGTAVALPLCPVVI
jgi:hypothetical protein